MIVLGSSGLVLWSSVSFSEFLWASSAWAFDEDGFCCLPGGCFAGFFVCCMIGDLIGSADVCPSAADAALQGFRLGF